MKKEFTWIFLFLCIGSVYANTTMSFLINNTDGFKYLHFYDSAFINKKFILSKGKIEYEISEPRKIIIQLNNANTNSGVWIENNINTEITIDGKDLKKRSFKNSILNNEYLQYSNIADSFQQLIDSNKRTLVTFKDLEFNIKNYALSLIYKERVMVLEYQLPIALYNWCLNNTSSFVCFDFINTELNNKDVNINFLRHLFAKLDTGLYKYPSYDKYKKLLNKDSYEIGDTIKNLNFLLDNDSIITFSKVAKNKYVYLDFWSVNNKESRDNHSTLNPKEIFDFYHQEVVIISICLESDKKEWLEASKKDKITWLNTIDLNDELRKLFKIKDVPSAILIDKNKVLINNNISTSHSGNSIYLNNLLHEQ